jgi:hypothetical protein
VTQALEPQDSRAHPLAPWFSSWRRERDAARGRAGAARKSRAAITIVHNEAVFLPIWLRYYSRFFGPEDLYVLDNETTDGSVERDGFVRIPVVNDEVDHIWMRETVEGLQHELLDRYDAVLVTDVDEIVSPVPEWGDLGQYIDRLQEEWVNCMGYEVLHMRDREPAFDTRKPVFDQRGWWYPNDAYDKPALATEAMTWKAGFHARADGQARLDPDLRLIHLHRMDYDICLQRHRTRNRRRWAERDQREAWAVHNQITEEREFGRWFFEDSSCEGVEIKPEKVRISWRGLL